MRSIQSLMINADLDGEQMLLMLPRETDTVYTNINNKFVWSTASKKIIGLCGIDKMIKSVNGFKAGHITVYLPKKELEEQGILNDMVKAMKSHKDVRNVKVVEMRE